METEDIPETGHASDWLPATDPLLVGLLAKLGEESGELATICSRCIAQGGLDEKDPATGKLNRDALQDELADVSAISFLAVEYLALNMRAIMDRRERKRAFKRPWFDWLKSLRK
jgi:hypothetical protein